LSIIGRVLSLHVKSCTNRNGEAKPLGLASNLGHEIQLRMQGQEQKIEELKRKQEEELVALNKDHGEKSIAFTKRRLSKKNYKEAARNVCPS
jgi:hypothetical protein